MSYFSSQALTTEVTQLSVDELSEDDLDHLTPGQIYSSAIRNTMPEIKLFSLVLLVVFVAAIFGLKIHGHTLLGDIYNKVLVSMLENRDEKLEALAEKQRISDSLRVDDRDREALKTVIDELKNRISSDNPRF